jgi:hypothetical protein
MWSLQEYQYQNSQPACTGNIVYHITFQLIVAHPSNLMLLHDPHLCRCQSGWGYAYVFPAPSMRGEICERITEIPLTHNLISTMTQTNKVYLVQNFILNLLLHRYTFKAWVNSVDPDQPTHPCCLIRICTGRKHVKIHIYGVKGVKVQVLN